MANFRLITKMCKQFAVYWAPDTIGDNGEWTFLQPIQIKCRWEGLDAILMRTSFPNQLKEDLTKIQVYVLQDVQVGGVLWLGSLLQCPSVKKTAPYDPFAGDELAKEIAKFTKYPTLNAKQFLRVATLS